MRLNNTGFRQWAARPVVQAVLVFFVMLAANLLVKLMAQGGVKFESRIPWTLNIAFLFLFSIYNVVLGLLYSTGYRYWSYSISCFIGLAFLSAWIAKWISHLSMDEAGSYRWLYFVFFIVYFFIMMITLAIRKIVSMAEQDDHRFDRATRQDN
jgi:hypothetical protein